MRYLFIALLLTGCATQKESYWFKQGASNQQFAMDRGECMSRTGMTFGTMNQMMVFSGCMQGRGWELRED